MSRITAAITAIGGYVPEYVLTNEELSTMVDTNDEWIKSRTGISERRILKGEGKALSDICVEAVKQLLSKRGIGPEDIDLLIVGTVTSDYNFPSTSNVVCDKLGAKNAWGYDLSAACSGFIYALATGAQFIETGRYKKVVVVGADMMSSILDYTDRTTCVIFGDGGGAVLLEPDTEGYGVKDFILRADGSGRKYLCQPAGGSLKPASHETVDNKQHYVYQEGKAVFKFAVTNMADVSAEIMEKNKLTADDVTWLVPHQANLRIIDATAERMGLDKAKVMINIQKFGNTTAGTIPLLLWEWESKLRKGDNLILSAFGGGFTWGALYLKWAYNSN
ncbi:MAG TPA: 3-oxoacyl-ACP synthase [Flavobacteriales bacterium]|nr:3-oxoacyl-ACP synthase [Flavobacteriales bacterium]HRE73856.1 beta-ketoacyl-ACP synthase III [Flavobacteriales bacterium]HRE98289.1 beta-ketoacyl-ACP synthase III [Flavobacteriales bacterium]HRJ35403.1 beta-ketoacyl-ACP synthase III [Flavobacteriales bacterium]HRJ39748.1 beta-ketoacyl-ACP synthase III [Flavobacteriales bacterium]